MLNTSFVSLIMQSILKTSTFLQTLYENELEDDAELSFDNFVNDDTRLEPLFQAYNKHNISFSDVKELLTKFGELDLHSNFDKPHLEEYFSKRLNFLLIIDFLLSLKEEHVYNNPETILAYFTKLSYFYCFMDYLDVEHSFLDYLKYMLVLYLQSLSRETIEAKFDHCLHRLDEFYKYEVVKELYLNNGIGDIRAHNALKLNAHIFAKKKLETTYADLIKDFNKDMDYLAGSEHLNKFFTFQAYAPGYSSSNAIIERTYTLVHNPREIEEREQELERRRIQAREQVYLEHGDYYDYDRDDHSDYSDDYDDDDVIQPFKKYNIELDDPNYEAYHRHFACRAYQCTLNVIEKFDNYIKQLDVGIKKHGNLIQFDCHSIITETEKDYNHIDYILTFIGERLPSYKQEVFDRKIYSFGFFNDLFTISYELGHFRIIIEIINDNPTYTPTVQFLSGFGYDEFNEFLMKKFPNLSQRKTTTYIQMKTL